MFDNQVMSAPTESPLGQFNLKEHLSRRKKDHENCMEKIDRIEALLAKNPEIEELLNLTRSLGI